MEALDQSLPVVQAHDAIERSFPGQPAPAVVVVAGPRTSTRPGPRAGSSASHGRAGHRRDAPPVTMRQVEPPGRRGAHPARRHGHATRLQHARRPAPTSSQHTIGAVPGVQADLTGETAGTTDFNQLMKARAPYVIGFVLVLAFVLLLVTFRSMVIPLKAIVLNLLSVAAAYGVLVAVFQHHWAEGILGFHENGAITRVAPDLPVRDPVRPLDGLPRVHPQPGQGAWRPRHADEERRGAGDHRHRRRRDLAPRS